MTAKDAIKLAHATGEDHRDEIKNKFILKATLRQLQEFIHGIYARDDNVYFIWAKIALDIRIARSLFWLTMALVWLTTILVVLTVTLVVLTYKLAQPNQAAPPSPPNSQSQMTTLPNPSTSPSPVMKTRNN
jgi:Na+/H+ antiporter NhaB